MYPYQLLLQQNPAASQFFPFYQAGFFFNEDVHLRQQAATGYYLLTAQNQQTLQTEARCAFFLKQEAVVSPFAAPFGSIELAENLPDTLLDYFIQRLIQAAQATGQPVLRLVNYPACYAPRQAQQLCRAFCRHGFRVTAAHQTAYLPIPPGPGNAMQPAQRRRLRKCQRANFQFVHWEQPVIADVVQFLVETRQQQGYPLSLPAEQLGQLLQTFPRQFQVFVVMDGAAIAALALTVTVRSDILYWFMPAYRISYRRFSPMVMLIDGLISYGHSNGFRLLDLGLSLDHTGTLKPGLLRFKQKMGAQLSTKLIVEKPLAHL